MTDLFDYARQKYQKNKMPLAARMRPRILDEFVGQEHIIGIGRLLRRSIEADQLSSIILWGTPGSGKTTLASIIANSTARHFATLNAVTDGIQKLRDVIDEARDQLGMYGKGTVLFIDEIHRWNRAQQDALLPVVEDGTVVLIGSTTENPFFSLVNPLLSRSRVFRLEPLNDSNIKELLQRALKDKERGYGNLLIEVTDDALNHLADVADGDARSAFNALELAVTTTPPDKDGTIRIGIETAQESIQKRVVRYDRGDDEHYDTASAFIKSMRGSDVDAALYWMAKMLYAGEDPRFIFRRMLILCCEDIGMADPNALVVVHSAAEAFERVGMPEGNYFLSHACIYCATAPKSNSAGAIFKAIAHVEEHGVGEVPTHLRDKAGKFKGQTQERYKEAMGDMGTYLYPHDYPSGWVEQRYLPEGMTPPAWYTPSAHGHEGKIADDWRKRRGH
ncbi:MAG: replication-associated recombination protein A [Anaerolineae bacterium]|nr:replication-associated recombination protein A [Anaerolineae bacterium]